VAILDRLIFLLVWFILRNRNTTLHAEANQQKIRLFGDISEAMKEIIADK